ncbi:GWxTD domain-containing protein [candidate division KSB1 bacterium]|nr:GWxTD domain-containing protein [candidate division KSB1 bacterium]
MKIFLSLLCMPMWAWAQLAGPTQPSPISFQLYNTSATDSSKSRLLVSVAVLHDNLSFAKNDSGYDAHYELGLDLSNAEGEWVAGREQKRNIHVPRFDATNSRRNYNAHAYEFDLKPGKYVATFNFTDRVSGAVSRMQATKELRAFSGEKVRVEMSDIIFLDKVKTDSLQRTVVNPDLQNNLTTPDGELYLYTELLCPNMSAPLLVRQTIRNCQGKEVVAQQREWPRRARLERVVLPINVNVMPYGVYEVEMKVWQGKAARSVRERFYVTWNGIPETGMHLDQALATAEYLGNKEEREQLETAIKEFTKEQKAATLFKFWLSRDETPETPDNEAMYTFYQRVELANAKFSGAQEGWKTDLGRTLVNYGVPDLVEFLERNTQAAQIQVWHYRSLARKFAFIDSHGNGDYRLLMQ